MNHFTTANNLGVNLFAFVLTICVLVTCAKGYYDSLQPSSDDLWNVDIDYPKAWLLYTYLSEDGWIEENVTYEEFDYIFVLTSQLSAMTEVRLPLAIAQIAKESRFDRYAEYKKAYGYFQLMPIYQQARMEKFVENDHVFSLDDFYNPRLNIATGLDYMNYILSETGGDEAYALMWFNQGPTSASIDYLDKLYVSSYAKDILELADHIELYLFEEGESCL